MKKALRFLVLICGLCAIGAQAQTIGNAWHIPVNTVPNSSSTMRSPLSGSDAGTTITVYNGNQFQGSGNPGDQSGGMVFYKSATGSYQSVPLGFFTQSGNDKFWVASFTAPSPGPVQYYLQITYQRSHHDLSLRHRLRRATPLPTPPSPRRILTRSI